MVLPLETPALPLENKFDLQNTHFFKLTRRHWYMMYALNAENSFSNVHYGIANDLGEYPSLGRSIYNFLQRL